MPRFLVVLALATASAIAATPASAQTTTMPARGAWGGELCFSCGVTVLKFRDTTSAWVLGLSGQFVRIRIEEDNVPLSAPEDDLSLVFRFGHRWYRPSATRLRPFFSLLGALGTESGDSDGIIYGASGNMGGAWFFSPHLSLGVAGVLDALHRTNDQDTGIGTIRSRITTVVLSMNLMASVFF